MVFLMTSIDYNKYGRGNKAQEKTNNLQTIANIDRSDL